MKKCPECGRDYNDDSLSYCLDDGAELLFGPSRTDEHATAILHRSAEPGEAPTRAQIHTTSGRRDDDLAEPHGNTSSAHKARKLLLIAAGVLVLGIGGFFAYRYFTPTPSDAINSIAVLPFE